MNSRVQEMEVAPGVTRERIPSTALDICIWEPLPSVKPYKSMYECSSDQLLKKGFCHWPHAHLCSFPEKERGPVARLQTPVCIQWVGYLA